MKVAYKGLTIHVRKVPGFPFYYAYVNNSDGKQVLRVERRDEAPTQVKILECAKWEIDQGYCR